VLAGGSQYKSKKLGVGQEIEFKAKSTLLRGRTWTEHECHDVCGDGEFGHGDSNPCCANLNCFRAEKQL